MNLLDQDICCFLNSSCPLSLLFSSVSLARRHSIVHTVPPFTICILNVPSSRSFIVFTPSLSL